ncbi:ribosome biogenesis GTPase Der [Petroclostridium sp. X23]|uniref:ribosome biogenesis GTPase Der n=1 Tax=Petroclostridium sp. X23 TaxID=3045146 RepID=UPI0024AE87C3|nr:ribosome biogenesis GTPase Der [Petroclostridium sp. X23]WHH59867.1 ribosome biogenesis GTPase Der [Petroclostridium sp. X23]
MAKPIVAIVGRPNVGKSTLFNKIVGQRISIVEDTPGVTRDRIYAEAEWLDRKFTIIDTGGIEPESKDELLAQMRRQAEIAIETAHVIMFIVDVKQGMTASDKDVASMLQRSGKPIVLICNKVDNIGEPPMELYEFYNLGLGEPLAVSSVHGLGIGDALDEIAEHFPDEEAEDYGEDVIKVAVIGKPNAGKSSLINKILGEERVIVSDIPGTTRDAIDTSFEKDGQKYVFIDTAGMRKKGKIYENIERYSVIRSLTAVERADVCLIMVDASEGVTEQDTKVAGFAHEQGKASIIVVNKWDLIEKDDKTMHYFRQDVMDRLSYMTYAPIAFISAKTGQRVEKLFDLIKYVSEQHATRISTGMLNDIINEATAKVQPPSDKGKRLKLLYATQASVKPPVFVIFVNDRELMHFSYERYLENQIRNTFGLEGTPVRFIIRERSKE